MQSEQPQYNHADYQAKWAATEVRRPNGASVVAAGWWAISIGVLLASFALIQPASAAAWSWPVASFGSGLVSLGILLWAVGQVVRAIFFLPGRVVTNHDMTIKTPVATQPPQ